MGDLEHSVSNSPSRANTQPPNTHGGHAQHHNDENLSYSEPTTAKEANASNNNPFHSELETTVSQFVEPTHFPKVLNSNGTAANIQSISYAAKSQINTQSAPVTPGHSPQSEKKNVVNNGYHSETDQNAANNELPPKLVSDSLLDQIMALPRDTIKGRIIQFGGTFSDDDATGILVTRLFQLLSSSGQSAKRLSAATNEEELGNEDATSSLIMGHNIQQQNSQLNKSKSYQSMPRSNKTSISPPNDYHHQQLQSSHNESIKSVSPKSPHTISPNIKQQHQHQMIVDDDDDDDDNELDPNIELPKLRIRQKELMKDKIRFEVQRLKQRTDNRLGRDMTVDNIASELAQVEKQIKVLTDASKSGNGQKRIKIKQK